ncbi:penicillin acylase family protein [Auraticoccus monumenti]|uniref:Penicillin amidase n=1 Tax=Auraticoccus monumenti TaxID=675864 RepID=A0A1G6YIH6_9ACTN|nr:penicillin acylase family protein [Auraticoccus monumenti]SDD90178.1 penicillin amidase [Auraticoccus monumenti]
MLRPLRIALFGVFVGVLLMGALSSLAVVQVRSSFPQSSGRIDVSRLSAEVEVVRDAAGVPHLYGDSVEDLYTAQGFVQAQDRFFEMDVRRHVTSGRLSELFGEAQLTTDAVIRTLGWRRVAEQEVALLSVGTRRALQAHAAGVNAYLASTDPQELSLEYTVLGLQGALPAPEPWTPVDSVAWLKAMAWELSDARTQELQWSRLLQLVGPERAAELYPQPDLSELEPVLPLGGLRNGEFTDSARDPDRRGTEALPGLPAGAVDALAAAGTAERAVPRLLGDTDGAIGSNSWVLSGEHTESGAPLLSNDPHLAIGIPSTFHQIGLHCRVLDEDCDLDVSGFSFAGMPGVVIGHNQSVAWGFTTPYLDTEDYVLERVRPDGTVFGEDGWQPLETRVEEIRVKGEDEARLITVRSTELGPLVSDVDAQEAAMAAQGGAGEAPVAPVEGEQWGAVLQSTALTPGPSLDALLAINRAQDLDQFREAARDLVAPSQNLVYADRAGTIGYQLPGAVPVREDRDGRLPARGWQEDAAWSSTIPFEQLPWSEDPAEGFLVTANQAVVGPDFPYRLHTAPSQGWRSQQIRDRLTELTADGGKVDAAEAEQLFSDTRVRYADALVPALVGAPVLEPWVADGQRVLAGWDLHADPDSAGAAWFAVLVREVLRLTFDDELPEELRPTGGDRWMAVLAGLVEDPDNPWWDDVSTPEVERRDDVLAEANLAARKEITALMSRDPAGWQWGRIHRLELAHQTLGSSGIGPVEALFNREGPGLGGTTGTVNALSWAVDEPGFVPDNGPTMRMLVDLSDLDASRWINQTGVSGHAFHPHYDDQAELWARDEMMPFVHSTEAVHAAGVDVLVLAPVQ